MWWLVLNGKHTARRICWQSSRVAVSFPPRIRPSGLTMGRRISRKCKEWLANANDRTVQTSRVLNGVFFMAAGSNNVRLKLSTRHRPGLEDNPLKKHLKPKVSLQRSWESNLSRQSKCLEHKPNSLRLMPNQRLKVLLRNRSSPAPKQTTARRMHTRRESRQSSSANGKTEQNPVKMLRVLVMLSRGLEAWGSGARFGWLL